MKFLSFACTVLTAAALACSNGPGPEGVIYYVSTAGDDENSGLSADEPFATLEHAADLVNAGCTVYVMPGTYSEEVVQDVAGRADAPILWIAYDSTQLPVLKGDGGDGREIYGFSLEQASYTRLIRLKVTGFTYGIHVQNSDNLLVERCVADDNFATGILIEDCSDVVVRYCSARGNAVNNSQGEGNGIWAEYCTNVQFEADTGNGNGAEPHGGTGLQFFGCTSGEIVEGVADSNRGNGILIEDCDDVVVHGNICRYNFADFSFDEWWCGGIWVDGGSDITVEQNMFAYTEGAGIEISDEDGTDPTGYVVRNNVCIGDYWGIWIGGLESAEVYCNTVVGSTDAGIWVSRPDYYPGPTKSTVVANNIVDVDGVPVLQIDESSYDATCSFDYNLYNDLSGEVSIDWEGSAVSFDSYVSASGWGANSLEADPLFTDRFLGDYRLDEGSPAIDAGWNNYKPDVDFDGSPRTGACDIGAFER